MTTPLERLKAEAENREPYPFAADLKMALAVIEAAQHQIIRHEAPVNRSWDEILDAYALLTTESTNDGK